MPGPLHARRARARRTALDPLPHVTLEKRFFGIRAHTRSAAAVPRARETGAHTRPRPTRAVALRPPRHAAARVLPRELSETLDKKKGDVTPLNDC